jgi:hypothetical protein
MTGVSNSNSKRVKRIILKFKEGLTSSEAADTLLILKLSAHLRIIHAFNIKIKLLCNH